MVEPQMAVTQMVVAEGRRLKGAEEDHRLEEGGFHRIPASESRGKGMPRTGAEPPCVWKALRCCFDGLSQSMEYLDTGTINTKKNEAEVSNSRLDLGLDGVRYLCGANTAPRTSGKWQIYRESSPQ
jgi:hypothetical protein